MLILLSHYTCPRTITLYNLGIFFFPLPHWDSLPRHTYYGTNLCKIQHSDIPNITITSYLSSYHHLEVVQSQNNFFSLSLNQGTNLCRIQHSEILNITITSYLPLYHHHHTKSYNPGTTLSVLNGQKLTRLLTLCLWCAHSVVLWSQLHTVVTKFKLYFWQLNIQYCPSVAHWLALYTQSCTPGKPQEPRTRPSSFNNAFIHNSTHSSTVHLFITAHTPPRDSPCLS